MSLINLSVKHGQSQEEARANLESTVSQVCAQFGGMVQKVEWSPDRHHVKIVGTGFTAQLNVDAIEVHATVDVPLLNGFLQNLLNNRLRGILERNFPKLLPK